jgi:hypothetical protein
MAKTRAATFKELTIDAIQIDDERSFRHLPLYAELKELLRRSRYRFRILPKGRGATWDRALFLNLTYWSPDAGGDLLVTDHLAADVVTHVAWHHLASRALSGRPGAAPTASSLFLGEAIASAFDLYMVGRLLTLAPRSEFLATQVPAMSEAAENAGATEKQFAAFLTSVARQPERAFADLRALLYDATTALYHCETAQDALRTLATFDSHRFGMLLHRYELSNWVLYARARGRDAKDARAAAVDKKLRDPAHGLPWLVNEWVTAALVR